MSGELDLVALLYRADWTRLSLTADVHGLLDEQLLTRQDEAHNWFGRSVPPGLTEVRHFHARLVVAPGGRYRVQADSRRDEFDFPHLRHDGGPDGSVPAGPDDAVPEDTGVLTRLTERYAEMLRPVSLLTGFALVLHGPATFAGRAAHHVVATPSPTTLAITPGRRSLDRIELFVDAETGILLHREEIYDGQPLRLTEFARARFGPLEAGDEAYFALDPVPGPASGEADRDAYQEFSQAFSGVGWSAAKTAADAAGAVLGTAIRMAPGGAGSGDASDPEAAIPADDPFPAGWASADPPSALISDGLLHTLVRGGSVPFTGVFHGWTDLTAIMGDFPAAAARHGWTGVGVVARALTERAGTTHKVSRVRFGDGGRYRIDVLHETGSGKNSPTASGCDGEQRWRLYPNRLTVGPAGPDSDYILTALVDASWLLRYELAGETELTYRGRPAYAVQATSDEYPVPAPAGIMVHSARAIIDAETGIVLLYVSGSGGRTAIRAELRDVALAGDEDDAAFRITAPPGVKVVPVSGNPFAELNVPDPVRTAAKTAAQASRVAERGFTAAKGFFDSLRERR